MSYIRTIEELEREGQGRRVRELRKVGLKHWLKPLSAWVKAFSKPYTIPRAQAFREGSANYRGFHVNDIESCTGCGNCEEVCMNKAIDMVPHAETTKKDTGLRPRLDYGRCCWCGLCVDICATGSLGLSNEYVLVSDRADDFQYTPGIEAKPWDGRVKGWFKQGKKAPQRPAAA